MRESQIGFACRWLEGLKHGRGLHRGQSGSWKRVRARNRILRVDNVGKVSVVYGDVDLIVEVDVKDLIELRELTEHIRRVEGVAKTVTYLVSKEP